MIRPAGGLNDAIVQRYGQASGDSILPCRVCEERVAISSQMLVSVQDPTVIDQ